MPTPAQSATFHETSKLTNKKITTNFYYLLTQAVKKYEQSYHPKQLATGLTTSEARMLMVLDGNTKMDCLRLLKEVNMPWKDVQQTIIMLESKRWISKDGEKYSLSSLGQQQADHLTNIAFDHQNEVFQKYSEQQIAALKTILQDLVGFANKS